MQPQSLLEMAVDGKADTCVELPSKYTIHYMNMCVGRTTRWFDVHLSATDSDVCEKTKVSMRLASDIREEDSCQTPRDYLRCPQNEPCTYRCQYKKDIECAVILVRTQALPENDKLCEFEIFFP